jgi:ATP-dependent helicase/nuclease subunit A
VTVDGRAGFTTDVGAGFSRPDEVIDARDREARQRAVDPRYNVALEASAGTGKTRVLVDRYVNLLRAGVAPGNILAITFTRKAAAEMRQRILAALRTAAERGEITPSRWRELRGRTGDIAISTIDAFCLSLLREFPLEADLDPGFSMADDTEVPRFIDESLDRALRICRGVAREDEHVALVFAQLGDRRVRAGLASLLTRRIVAPLALSRHLTRGPRDLTVAQVSRRGAAALREVFDGMKGGLDRFLETGPTEPVFLLLRWYVGRLPAFARSASAGPPKPGEGGKAAPTSLGAAAPTSGGNAAAASAGQAAPPSAADLEPAEVQAIAARVRDHFLTREGTPRTRLAYTKAQFVSAGAWQVHRDLVVAHAPRVREVLLAYRRDLNVLVSRGVARMFGIADAEYRRTLDAHAVLDFSDVLLRTLGLLRQMEEFSQSRYRLESRYHHVLVDEFQDTSRAQWELISLLVQAWGEGAGLAYAGPIPPSIFIVGDRKQSIYGFRDAQASILREASAHLGTLRQDGDVRRSISRSFRSVPALLSFVNDVCQDVEKVPSRADSFQYDEADRFPIDAIADASDAPAVAPSSLACVVGDSPEVCADETAAEIARLIAEGAAIRDRDSGVRRAIRPGDIAILFRTRDSHREFAEALERRSIPSYVYKGLGFFDADEIKDILALLWYLADSLSDLRAAAFLRSRFLRLSDEGLRRLAPGLAESLRAPDVPAAAALLDRADRAALDIARRATSRWRNLVDRLPPAELVDLILGESAYAFEIRGPRAQQARENLKKIRSLIRRIQNRGYATLGRIAAHLDRLAVGDEANAVIDARDAVHLMTVHAAKGLEFPVVFLVDLGRGAGHRRAPIRVDAGADDAASVAVGDFQSEADEDHAAREREEAKRLLYVALTRARDLLYLGVVLTDGRLVPGRGSLADVLPASLVEAFAAAVASSDVPWRDHTLRVCQAARDRQTLRLSAAASTEAERPSGDCSFDLADSAVTAPHADDSDLLPLVDSAPLRLSVAQAVSSEAERPVRRGGGDSDRLVGTLVHRLLRRLPIVDTPDTDELGRRAKAVLMPEEAVDLEDPAGMVDQVVAAFTALCSLRDLRDLYASGLPLHEVPFTLREGDRIIRGTIDCLILRPGPVVGQDGGVDQVRHVTVVEFKTGRRRPEHDSQAELYTQAIRAAYPTATVDTRLFYTAGAV